MFNTTHKYSKTPYWELPKGNISIDDPSDYLDNEFLSKLTYFRRNFNWIPYNITIKITGYNEIFIIHEIIYPYDRLPLSNFIKFKLLERIMKETGKFRNLYPDIVIKENKI